MIAPLTAIGPDGVPVVYGGFQERGVGSLEVAHGYGVPLLLGAAIVDVH